MPLPHSHPDLVARFFHNQERWLERVATGLIHPEPGNTRLRHADAVTAVRSGNTGVIMLHTTDDTITDLHDHDRSRAWLNFYGSHDVLTWSQTPRPAMDLALQAQGYNESFAPTWMARSLADPLPQDIDIPATISDATADDVTRLAATNDVPYAMKDHIESTLALSNAPEPDVTWLIARHRNIVVGQAILNITGRTAGLFNVAVHWQHRRKGIGYALTRLAMKRARDAEATHMCLNSTGAGISVYTRAGFSHIGEGQTWLLPTHRLRSPAPSALTHLAGHIGAGDINALANIPIPPSLPNGETPIQFASRFDQPAMARFLLEQGAQPDIIALWKLGLRDEATAAMADPSTLNRPAGDRGATPLHHAVERGWGTLVLLLLDAGANVFAEDREYESTPLGWARALHKPTIAAILTRAEKGRSYR